jgi:hypothetical protein
VPDLPWFVYAMLLAPLGLILVAAACKTLQVRAIGDWPSTPGKVASNSELREIKVSMIAARMATVSSPATSPTSLTNIRSAARLKQQPRQHRRGPR